MAWFLILALVICLIACIVWARSIWQNHFGSRDMDFDSREFALIAQARAELSPADEAAPAKAARTPQNATTVYVPPLDTPVAGAAEAPGKAASQREGKHGSRPPALLDAAAQALYLDLRTATGSYPLLACVDVAVLLASHQTQPPRAQADFVICRRDFTPVVAIFLEQPQPNPQRERALQMLKQSRLRVLRWDAANPPSKEEMQHSIFKPRREEAN